MAGVDGVKVKNNSIRINNYYLILCKLKAMQVFYAPDIDGNEYVLNENESGHCIRVLRMKAGSPVKLIDGKGSLYDAVISKADPGKCLLTITRISKDFEKRAYTLHIAISPLKNYDRFEWFLEKSVEIGVDEITPLICDNTEKTGFRRERMSNIIISAMKQSLKPTLTILNEPCRFGDFIGKVNTLVRMIAHCNASHPRSRIPDIYSPGQDAVILIGPEGDFSGKEILAAAATGFTGVHLGTSRLRSETAGIAACCSVYLLNQ
jgi:16S rRNA (uracil1498-N3)-methyltransferase